MAFKLAATLSGPGLTEANRLFSERRKLYTALVSGLAQRLGALLATASPCPRLVLVDPAASSISDRIYHLLDRGSTQVNAIPSVALWLGSSLVMLANVLKDGCPHRSAVRGQSSLKGVVRQRVPNALATIRTVTRRGHRDGIALPSLASRARRLTLLLNVLRSVK